MKVAIMVMAANAEPSTRNLDAIQNTLVKYQNEHRIDLRMNMIFISTGLEEKIWMRK